MQIRFVIIELKETLKKQINLITNSNKFKRNLSDTCIIKRIFKYFKMNFIKSLTFMLFTISIAFGAKPTDQYKDMEPFVRPTVIRDAKPTDQYKDTGSYLRPIKLV